ncbi:hypothetical protein HAX54_006777, partial [Datura stramonium]|nr:hypothetical protein [Datura stramonium]
MGDHQEHIVMLPFLTLGHMIPFLALSKRIQERTSYKITIVSTPFNVKYLSSTIAKDSTEQVVQNPKNISLVSLPYNSSEHGLPPNTENREALPLKYMLTIFHSILSLKDPLTKLVLEITDKDAYVSVWLNLPHLLASDGVFKMPEFDDSCSFFSINQLHPFMKSVDGFTQFMDSEVSKRGEMELNLQENTTHPFENQPHPNV